MQEYKRDKVSLEAKLKETSKATAYHNDHLRIIDSWYSQVSKVTIHNIRLFFCFFLSITNALQLIDEIKLLFGNSDGDSKGKFNIFLLLLPTIQLTIS